MEQSTKEAWRRLLDEARRELPDATVRTWLEPAVPIALDDDRLIVGAPDQFAVEWNEQKHSSVLARAAERVFGRPTAVVFRVQEDRQQRPQMDFFVAPRSSIGAAVDRTAGPTTPLNERYTFQMFVIGKSNELAAAAAHAVAEAPGKTYNPLFIYGATGLGKTHLMQAIAHAVLEKYPGTRVLLQHGVGDRLHQMRLAEARRAVDEQRVVRLAGSLRHGMRRRRRELVRFPDDEHLEGVPLVQRRRRTRRPVDGGPDGAPWRHEEIHLRPLLAVLLHPEDDGRGAAEDALRGPREHARMLLLVPLHRELVRRPDDQAIVI